MRHYYDSFENDFEAEFCETCQLHRKYIDWDEGGADRVGGMSPTRVVVHECLYRGKKSQHCALKDGHKITFKSIADKLEARK